MPSWDRLSFRLVDVIKKFTGDIEKDTEMSNFVGNIEKFEHMEILLLGERLRYGVSVVVVVAISATSCLVVSSVQIQNKI